MSLSVTAYPMGLRSVAAGANPSFISGRGHCTPWTSRQFITGPSLMSNVGFSTGHFDMQVSPSRSRDLNQ